MDSVRRTRVSSGQTVFARWSDGYYYPAVVAEVLDNQIKAAFLDGDSGLVSKDHVIDLEDGFKLLQLQGNWQHHGYFFKGTIENPALMIMHYNDGDVEQVELVQLRGALPGEKRARKRSGLVRLGIGLAFVGGIVGWSVDLPFLGIFIGLLVGMIFIGIISVWRRMTFSSASQSVSPEAEQLRSLYQAGLITKEEYKRRKNLLRW